MIQPMNDYCLIKRIEEHAKRMIIAPDIANVKSMKGQIIAVGPGKKIDGERVPLVVKAGDVVYFNSKWNDFGDDHYTTSSYIEARTNAEREKLHLVQEADIFGIVNE